MNEIKEVCKIIATVKDMSIPKIIVISCCIIAVVIATKLDDILQYNLDEKKLAISKECLTQE